MEPVDLRWPAEPLLHGSTSGRVVGEHIGDAIRTGWEQSPVLRKSGHAGSQEVDAGPASGRRRDRPSPWSAGDVPLAPLPDTETEPRLLDRVRRPLTGAPPRSARRRRRSPRACPLPETQRLRPASAGPRLASASLVPAREPHMSAGASTSTSSGSRRAATKRLGKGQKGDLAQLHMCAYASCLEPRSPDPASNREDHDPARSPLDPPPFEPQQLMSPPKLSEGGYRYRTDTYGFMRGCGHDIHRVVRANPDPLRRMTTSALVKETLMAKQQGGQGRVTHLSRTHLAPPDMPGNFERWCWRCAIHIQRVARGYLYRLRHNAMIYQQKTRYVSACYIQRSFRGRMARTRCNVMQNESRSACHIQRFVRGHLSRVWHNRRLRVHTAVRDRFHRLAARTLCKVVSLLAVDVRAHRGLVNELMPAVTLRPETRAVLVTTTLVSEVQERVAELLKPSNASDAAAEPDPELELEPVQVPELDLEPVPLPDQDHEPEPERENEAVLVPEPVLVVEVETQPAPEPAPEPEPEPEPEPQPEPQPEPEQGHIVVPELVPELKPELEPVPVPVPQQQPQEPPEPVLELEAELEPESPPQSQPQPESTPDATVVADEAARIEAVRTEAEEWVKVLRAKRAATRAAKQLAARSKEKNAARLMAKQEEDTSAANDATAQANLSIPALESELQDLSSGMTAEENADLERELAELQQQQQQQLV
jgi:hypothetical protein